MPSAIAIRHVCFEDLGLLGPLLTGRGFAVDYRDAGVDEFTGADEADLLVVLGGPIGAYEEHLYPFLTDELRLIEARLRARRPTLGICLGAQLMARALGGRVYPGTAKEIGWAPLTLSEDGAASCLRHLAPEATAVLHWHGDTFDLPAGARHLASTATTPNQAFSWGEGAALGLQFHAEAASGLERWFIGHACEIAAVGIDVGALRADTRRHAAGMIRQGTACFTEWLDGLAISSAAAAGAI